MKVEYFMFVDKDKKGWVKEREYDTKDLVGPFDLEAWAEDVCNDFIKKNVKQLEITESGWGDYIFLQGKLILGGKHIVTYNFVKDVEDEDDYDMKEVGKLSWARRKELYLLGQLIHLELLKDEL